MTGMTEFAFSTKMRDTINKMIEEVVGKTRPQDRYGVVQSIDLVNRKCSVLMTGDPAPVIVNMGALIPAGTGTTVRVSGTQTDRYVADVFGAIAPQVNRFGFDSPTEATLASTDNALQIGPTSGLNVVFDGNEIQARSDGAAGSLDLNPHGGNVTAGGHFVAGANLWGAAAQLGSQAAANLVINGNQVYARNVGANDGILYLNHASQGQLDGTGFYDQVRVGKNGSMRFGGIAADRCDQINTVSGAGMYLRLNWETIAGSVAQPVAIGGSGTRTLIRDGLDVTGSITSSGGASISGGFTTVSDSALGTALIVSGGQMNAAVSPPTGTSPSAGVAFWVLTGGTNYRLYRNTSSLRYKENVQDLDQYTPEQILSLNPRRFQRNDHQDFSQQDEDGNAPFIPADQAPWSAGFIAEEANELGLAHWVSFDGEGRVDSFAYGDFAAVAHQIVLRAQQKKIEQLEAKLASFEERLAALEAA